MVLRYLCKNNPAYKANNIQINESILNDLPENDVPSDLNTANDEFCQNVDNIIVDNGPYLQENQNENQENLDGHYEAFIETSESEALQINNIEISINFPEANKKAINEFEIDSICSFLFPKLFPNGAGDPTTKGLKNF